MIHHRPDFKPGFRVMHGNRLEDLRELLLHFINAHTLPPLVPEVILVQSNGMKHWLELQFAQSLGICAATQMELPSGYLWQIYRRVLGAQAVPQHMPFDKSRLVWRLVRLLPTLSDPIYEPLQRYLGQQGGQGGQGGERRVYQLALQLADVFDGYQSYRADWLTAWATGAVPPDTAQAWQAQLWRDLRADIGEALADASRAAVHDRFLQALPNFSGSLPPRIVVFGISSLPMQTVQALAALGQHCQVVMLVQNPCRHYWGGDVAHPLLASWGKQGRDYLHLIDEANANQDRIELFVDPLTESESADAGVGANDAESTLLQHLQSSILNLHALPEQPAPLLGDDSIRFAATHSAQREVEVLHDHLLACLDADPHLQPQEIMVMVPDMAVFAPHIAAVFGRFTAQQPRHIPYTLADTTPRRAPLVLALEQLLKLPSTRLTLADWHALFEVSAIRHRFGVDEAKVTQLHGWLQEAGVRWGLDTPHRAAWGMDASLSDADQNTWAFGLRRLLLGYAVGTAHPWGGVAPLPALSGLDNELAEALLDWLQAIDTTRQALVQAQTPLQWGQTLRDLVGRFFSASDDADERMLQTILTPLDEWLQACAEAALTTPVSLDMVREHWLSQLADSGLQQRFFGGGVQFGTLMPMRSIPFKHICLLGMNDCDYPRQHDPQDFDLMAQSWRAGDRSRREDDRYLFLEALLSAREKLYISWQGCAVRDNSTQPPSVLIAQLLDYLHAAWAPKVAVLQHPLQAFSPQYFLQGSVHQTYDADWARVHHITEAQQPYPSLEHPCPTTLTLDDLHMLLRQPVEVFFRARLGVQFDALMPDTASQEPFALNGLAHYILNQELLDPSVTVEQLRLGGQLPLGAFGTHLAADMQDKAYTVLARQTPWLARYPQEINPRHWTLDFAALTPHPPRTLSGVVGQLWSDEAGRLLQLQQRVGAVTERGHVRGHLLVGLWLRHIFVCANGVPVTSVQLGLDGEIVLPPTPPKQAQQTLQDLLSLYQEAWARPLAVAAKTAWAWLQQDKPREAFEGGFASAGELTTSPYLQRAFNSFDDIATELPHWAERLYGALHHTLAQTEPCS